MKYLYIALFIGLTLLASGYDSLTAKQNQTGTKLFTAYKTQPVDVSFWHYNRR